MTTDDEREYLWQRRSRHVFALLREAGISEREQRLNLFRWIVADPTISSTNDLSEPELAMIADLLDKWKRQNELVERTHEHIGPMQGRDG